MEHSEYSSLLFNYQKYRKKKNQQISFRSETSTQGEKFTLQFFFCSVGWMGDLPFFQLAFAGGKKSDSMV